MPSALEPALPLTHSQMAMWLQWKYAPDDPAYNNPLLFDINGPLDVERLAKAFTAVADAHPAIRMRFSECDGVPQQTLAPAAHDTLARLDLTALDPATRDARAAAAIEAAVRAPFDLASEPVHRFLLVRTGADTYRLVLNIHHVCVDGASAAILLADLSAAYRDLDAYRAAAVSGPSFAAALALERERWSASEHERAAAAWREQLAGRATGVDFGRLAFAREAAPGGGAAQFRWTLPVNLKQVQRQTRTTPFIVLMSAFGILLHRYLQLDTVSIAYPVDTRAAALSRMFGSFINFVPACLSLDDELTVQALLEQMRQQRRVTKPIADFPQVDLMRIARRELNDAAAPCLNVALIPARFALDMLDLDGVATRQVACFTGAAKQDLALLYDGDESIELILEYRTEVLSEAVARQLARDFDTIVAQLVAHPERRIGDLALRDDAAFAQRYARLAAPAPSGSAAALIDAALLAHPARLVAGRPGHPVTARALHEAANHVAHQLQAIGVVRGDRVGVAMPRGAVLLAALLGIWRAGATYVPLPLDLPPARRAGIVADAGLAALCREGEPAEGDPPALALSEAVFAAPELAPFEAAADDPDALAYLIYTSGSTGTPKGVELTQRNLASFLMAMRERLPAGAGHRMLATTTIGFDISLLEMLWPLVSGGTMVACPEPVRLDAAALARTLEHERIDWLQGTPSLFNVLRAGGWGGSSRLHVLCGGEPVDASILGFLRETCASVRLVYGPTEASIWSTLAGPETAEVTLGEPLGNTTVHLLDRRGRTAPRFSRGEIAIGGHGVARGYRGRADLSAERFVTLPDLGRVYLSGDFAYRDAQDALHFLGREDGQIKIRGFRVELGEIERQLETLDGVGRAIVQVSTSAAAEPMLIGWVMARAGEPLAEAPLRAALAARLPAYMVPARILMPASWPINANGKIDRRALLEALAPDGLAGAGASGACDGAAAPDALDARATALQAIYAQVLGVGQVDPDASLIALGGHSLSAVRIIAQVRKDFGLEIGLESLMSHSSVRALAAYLNRCGAGEEAMRHAGAAALRRRAEAQGAAPDAASASTAPGGASLLADESGARPAAPASHEHAPSASERALYFLDSVSVVRQTYNIPVGLRFPNGIDLDLLERALRDVLAAHPSLRAVFEPSARGLVKRCVSLPPGSLLVRHPGIGFAALRPVLERMLREPFELGTGPLWRAHAFPLDGGGDAVFMLFHHIVIDGIGCGNFLRELGARYEALLADPAAACPLAAPAAARCEPVPESRVEALIERFALADRVLPLPYTAPFPEIRSLAGESRPIVIDAPLREALGRYSRERGIPLAALFLGAYALALHQASGEPLVNVGLATMNRTPDTLLDVGLHTNTVVLPIALDPAARLDAFVERMTGELFAIYEYADVPFEAVASRLVADASLGRTPVFQTFFNFIDRSMYAFSMAGLPVHEIPLRPTGSKFELSLEVNDFGTSTELFLEYSHDVLDAAAIDDFAAELMRILLDCVHAPDTTIGQLTLTTQP
ncbi:non-ribosomal peptide synthetase [Burkholderia glumae]|uniref:Non-ribosomal peptide synthetase n=3 Tax=Burkholderia glumae TaxID=337 RepID=A0AAP9Y2H8_BURGL|nr:non-ribosomal peptide synthetase [Burkholderia glumae]ACR28828.1 Putative siderophore non-ribosomal peptide synthetase MbaF [Burkholderia glumae BGR1]AJY65749.1 amino acid adenylation domain protein [Burkholderia glumae LMG 2196 = ATCC 33617]MCM2483289.1 non-ribosomal peptide synthetase [Burkholderia glumae]MCM2506606.1 non-ribosomal peptide synthetase [Burkholderia glumae]MCM2538278.1 non-ribosomal peptide synthetase [Burkholderia glumae]